MTSRGRLLAVLRGQIPDRVPVSPFVQEEYLAFYYPQKETVDRVKDARELAEELDFDLIAKPKSYEKPAFLLRSFPDWEVCRSQARVDGLVRDRLEIRTPSGVLTQEEVGPDAGSASAGIHKSVSKHLLDTEEAMRIFLCHLPPFSDALAGEMREQVAAWRGILGERGVLAPWCPGGVFNLASELCGTEAILLMPYEDEEAYHAFMTRLTEAILPAAVALASTEAECVGIQANMANSAVMSEEFFREHVMPYEQRLINAIHAAGAFTVYHSCGFARRIQPVYREMKMTVWETVAPPPQGDNDLAEAKVQTANEIVLLGNLDQVLFLKRATPAEVAERARAIVRAGMPGGYYIFSTSDFLEKDTPKENVQAMIAAAKEAGVYA